MKQTSFYVLVPLFSTILTLVGVEAGLEMFYPIPYSLERDLYYAPDSFTGYRLNPNGFQYYQHGILASVNSHGHRDKEVSLSRPPNVFRLLVLGDSFTMGANVDQEQVYPQVLERLLANNTTRGVEVINAGVGGWAPFHYAQYYEHYGQEFNPDVVLVGFYVGNDTNNQVDRIEQTLTAVMGRRVSRSAAATRSIRVRLFAYERSHISRLVMNRQKPLNTLDFTRDTCQDFTMQYLEIMRWKLANHLRRDQRSHESSRNSVSQILRIKALADQDRVSMAVVLIPDEIQVNPDLRNALVTKEELTDYDFGMPQSMLKEIFLQHAIPLIDLLPVFVEDNNCLYMNDTHWSEEGHDLAATEIYRSMIEMNLVPN